MPDTRTRVWLRTTLPGDEHETVFGPFDDHVDSWGETFDELINTYDELDLDDVVLVRTDT